MRNFVIIFILVVLYGCGAKTVKIEIIKCNISLDSAGVIDGSSYNKHSIRTKTNNEENIDKFNKIYERVDNDDRYKCVGYDYVIEFVKGGKATSRLLYVNTRNAGKNFVWITNSDHNGYITIANKEWKALLKLTD